MPRRLEDVERMIADIDKDNSQTVDFDEFLQVGLSFAMITCS